MSCLLFLTAVQYSLLDLFVLRFYGPVNPMGSCQVWSVYLITHLLGRLSPLSGVLISHFVESDVNSLELCETSTFSVMRFLTCPKTGFFSLVAIPNGFWLPTFWFMKCPGPSCSKHR